MNDDEVPDDATGDESSSDEPTPPAAVADETSSEQPAGEDEQPGYSGTWRPIAIFLGLLLVVGVGLAALLPFGGTDDDPGVTADDPSGSTTDEDGRVTPDEPPAGDRDLLVPEDGALLGAFIAHDDGYTKEQQQAAFVERETAMDRRYDIGHAFYPWGREFPSWREEWHRENGRIPMISWGPGHDSDEVVAGDHDAAFRERAVAIADFGTPVFLRWFWEMDGSVQDEDSIGTPEEYVAAWRHIHGIFTDEGATNAVWVWCPTVDAFDDDRADQWYPGDDHVDWVCADGYNWAPGQSWARWRDLDEIFVNFHEWGEEKGKPMMVGEFGVMEDAREGRKAEWYDDAAEAMQTDLDGVRAWVFFDIDKAYDWRVTSSPSALESFTELTASPWFARASVHEG